MSLDKNEALACLIIDDPLLRPKYGCLDYEKLLMEMKEHNFFTEIAFIPWNYNRSDPGTVKLFADNVDYFAMCVHGCNHTDNEFGDSDYQKLLNLANLALWRMEHHKKKTGLEYDPVIVFPQGNFSSPAMKALKDQGYMAAFNSTLKAVNSYDIPHDEYVKPATYVYHDLPLFLRRYPKDKEGFIEDIKHGRPIVIVEHHGAFRNGYKTITDLVDWINNLGHIKWTSLGNIADYYLGSKPCIRKEKLTPLPVMALFDIAKISLRRHLSEARDNYVETSELLTKLHKYLKR